VPASASKACSVSDCRTTRDARTDRQTCPNFTLAQCRFAEQQRRQIPAGDDQQQQHRSEQQHQGPP
jgi:hypothetical protein